MIYNPTDHAALAASQSTRCVLQAATVKEPLFFAALAAFAQSFCWTSQDRVRASAFLLKIELPTTWNWAPEATTGGAEMPPRAPVKGWRLLESVLPVADVGEGSVGSAEVRATVTRVGEKLGEELVELETVAPAVSFDAAVLLVESVAALVEAEVSTAVDELGVTDELVDPAMGSPASWRASTSLKLVWMPKTSLNASASIPSCGVCAAAAS